MKWSPAELGMTPEQLEATNLLTKTFERFISRSVIVGSFRIVGFLGSQYVGTELDKNPHFADEFSHPLLSELFIDGEGSFKSIGGYEDLGKYITKRKFEDFKTAVDAASLVFAHSILDDATLGYCRVTAIISPKDWEQLILNKETSLKEVKSKGIEEIIKTRLKEYIESLERERLLSKVELLFKLCRPPRGFSRIANYKYDRDRLKELNNLRNSIVHGDGPIKKLPNGEEDIEFLFKTTLHLMTLITYRYGVEVNPWVKLMSSS